VSLLQLFPEFPDDDHVELGIIEIFFLGNLPAGLKQLFLS
jgi:hypothetical protein